MKKLFLIGLFCVCISANVFAENEFPQPDYTIGLRNQFQPATSYYKGEKEVEAIQQQRLENQMLALKIRQEREQLQQEQAQSQSQQEVLNTQMRRGCCSSHGGVIGCDTNTHYLLCRDNTESPSCGCNY